MDNFVSPLAIPQFSAIPMIAGEEPPYLSVGTDVSAKYRGAFCEAKVKKIVRSIRCKVVLKETQTTVSVTDDCIKGVLKIGATVEVKHPETAELMEGVITKLMDSSMYTVVFDDADERTLRRTQICLKGEKHFIESETLDNLPLSHPEHFGTPVIQNKTGGKRGRFSSPGMNFESSGEESDDAPKRQMYKGRLQEMVGKVKCLDNADKKKSSQCPVLVVLADAHKTELRNRDHLLVRSFKDSKFLPIHRKELKEFTRECASKNEDKTLKASYEKALLYFYNRELPNNWDKDNLLGAGFDDDMDDDYYSDDEPSEEKDLFVAQLYKFMDDRGTPINKGPTVGSQDLNLYRLFQIVQHLGGYNKATNQMRWGSMYSKMGLPPSNTAAHQLRNAYKKYLHAFEDFYRKLGSTMGTISRPGRSRHNSGRTIIAFRREKEGRSPRKPKETTDKGSKPDDIASKKDLNKSLPIEDDKSDKVDSDRESVISVRVTRSEKDRSRRETQSEVKDEPKDIKDRKEDVMKEDGKKEKVLKKDKEDHEEEGKKKAAKKDEKDQKKDEKETKKEDIKEVKKDMKSKKDDVSKKGKDDKSKKDDKPPKKESEDKGPCKSLEPNDAKVDSEDEERLHKKRIRKKSTRLKVFGDDDEEPSDKKEEKGKASEEKNVKEEKKEKCKESEKKEKKMKEERRDLNDSKPGAENDVSESDSDEKYHYDSGNEEELHCGTKLKVRYGRGRNAKIYEAKVVETGSESKVQYLVHYAGWNNRYDEWIRPERIVSVVEKPESMRKLKPKSQSPKPGAVANKKRPITPVSCGRSNSNELKSGKPRSPASASSSGQQKKVRMTRANSLELPTLLDLPSIKRRRKKSSNGSNDQASHASENDSSDEETEDEADKDDAPSLIGQLDLDISIDDSEKDISTEEAEEPMEQASEVKETKKDNLSKKSTEYEPSSDVADIKPKDTSSVTKVPDVLTTKTSTEHILSMPLDVCASPKKPEIIAHEGKDSSSSGKLHSKVIRMESDSTMTDNMPPPMMKMEAEFKMVPLKNDEMPPELRKEIIDEVFTGDPSSSQQTLKVVDKKEKAKPKKKDSKEMRKMRLSDDGQKSPGYDFHSEHFLEGMVVKPKPDILKKSKEEQGKKAKDEITIDKVVKDAFEFEEDPVIPIMKERKFPLHERFPKGAIGVRDGIESDKKKVKRKKKLADIGNTEITIKEKEIKREKECKKEVSKVCKLDKVTKPKECKKLQARDVPCQASNNSGSKLYEFEDSDTMNSRGSDSPEAVDGPKTLPSETQYSVPSTSAQSSQHNVASSQLTSKGITESVSRSDMQNSVGSKEWPLKNTVIENTPPTSPECSSEGAEPGSDPPRTLSDPLATALDSASELMEMPTPGSESPNACNASTISNESSGSSGNIPSSDSSNETLPVVSKRKMEAEGDQTTTPSKKKKRVMKRNSSMSTTDLQKDSKTGSESDEGIGKDHKGCSPCHMSSPAQSPARFTAVGIPRPSKYNFNLEEGKYLEGEKRISFLVQKCQDIRQIYMSLKAEVATIDRRRKRARRKERENSQASSSVEVECA